MWKWANSQQPRRLVIQEQGEHAIKFIDTEADEAVLVHAPDSLNVSMTILKEHAARPVPERVETITRDQSHHFVKGTGLTTRDVWHFVTRHDCAVLRVGLTIHRRIFSSTPHEFEMSSEPGFEEVFYFLLPNGGKAVLEGEGMWPNGDPVDAAWPVRHRQLAQVPIGWHRVVAMADEDSCPRVAYVWAYLAIHPEWEKGDD